MNLVPINRGKTHKPHKHLNTMKRYDCLYEDITNIFNLHTAHRNACKGKGHYKEVQQVNDNKYEMLDKLHEDLVNKRFTTSKYKIKKIYEPKERTIYALPYYPDRITQHAIMQVLQPIWDKMFIYDLYSAIPGKGIHKAITRLRYFLNRKQETQYCLQFDIKSYYPSMNHEILMNQIKHKIKCKDTLWILNDIINSIADETNIPIGNYLSQYFGNIYLNGLDHFLKEKHGVKQYIRYNDDGIILSSSKKHLWYLLDEIENYVNLKLGLTLNAKTRIYPVDKTGIDFLGYKTYPTHCLLRKRTVNKFKNKLVKIKNMDIVGNEQHIVSSVMSYVGWMQHANCYNLLCRYIFEDENLKNIIDACCANQGYENPLKNKYDDLYDC